MVVSVSVLLAATGSLVVEDTVAELDRTSGSFGAFTVTVIVAAEGAGGEGPGQVVGDLAW